MGSLLSTPYGTNSQPRGSEVSIDQMALEEIYVGEKPSVKFLSVNCLLAKILSAKWLSVESLSEIRKSENRLPMNLPT